MPTLRRAVLIACFLLLLPAFAWSETVTLVADEWPPYNGVPNSSEEGCLVDIARAVFEPEGIQVTYLLMPWRRAVESTRTGDYNGLIGASKTDAPDFIFPVEELSRNVLAFYVRTESNWQFRQRSDIRDVALGVIAGYDYRRWLLDYIEAHRDEARRVQVMTGTQPLQRNIQKLLSDRIGAIVDNEAVILDVARRMGIGDRIKLAGYGTEIAFIYIAFSPNHPESRRYAKLLSEGIVSLRKSGRLDKIFSRYGLQDWK